MMAAESSTSELPFDARFGWAVYRRDGGYHVGKGGEAGEPIGYFIDMQWAMRVRDLLRATDSVLKVDLAATPYGCRP